MPRIPDVIGGRYRIERRIGVGGMGELLLGQDPSLRRLVAIKLLREDLATDEGDERLGWELRQRFINEAKAAAGLNHPNIVVIYDVVDEPNGRPFIVMEYVQGRTLASIISAGDPIPLPTKLRLMEQLCDGLSCAHESELKIVHRDIKPANLMIDKQNNLKILDFGIARLGNMDLTRTGSLMGTPHYMAPEQFAGRSLDYRCDIWAVGTVCYELLSYVQAFPGSDGLERRIINQHPPALDSLPRCAGIDPRLVRVVNRALEKEPERRFKNMKAMETEIREIRLSLEGTTTPPISGAGATMPPGGPPAVTPRSTVITPAQPADSDDLGALLEQRASQIDANLNAARQAIATANLEAALRACNQVFFFDPRHPEAQAIAGRAREGLDEQRVNMMVTAAHADLARGQFDEAARVAGLAKALRPTSTAVVKLLIAIEEARREDAERGSRERAIDGHLEEAERALERRDAQVALRAINQVLMLDRANLRGQTLQHEAYQLLAEQQRVNDLRGRAARAIEDARARFADGEYTVAIAMLEAFPTPIPSVTEALSALQAELEALARRHLEEATARVAEAREKFATGLHQEAIADLESATPVHPLITAALTDLRVRAEQYQSGLDERAAKAVEAARRTFERGRHQDAIAKLADHSPGHVMVDAALSELRGRAAETERAEAERTRLVETEQTRKADAERARKEESDSARQAELELARQAELELAQLAELERARLAELERGRQAKAEIERARKQEAERAKKVEVERARKVEAERSREAKIERARLVEVECVRQAGVERVRQAEVERDGQAHDATKTWAAIPPPQPLPRPTTQPPPADVKPVEPEPIAASSPSEASARSRVRRSALLWVGVAVVVGAVAFAVVKWTSSSPTVPSQAEQPAGDPNVSGGQSGAPSGGGAGGQATGAGTQSGAGSGTPATKGAVTGGAPTGGAGISAETRARIERELLAGVAAHENADYAAARAAYRRVLVLDPNNMAAKAGIAKADSAERAERDFNIKK